MKLGVTSRTSRSWSSSQYLLGMLRVAAKYELRIGLVVWYVNFPLFLLMHILLVIPCGFRRPPPIASDTQ